MSFLQKDGEQLKKEQEEALLLVKLKVVRKKKLTEYWIREKKSYETMKQRELKLIDYNREPYMNESDWRHDNNWFLCIQKQMELDEQYYNSLEKLYSATIQDLL